MVQINLNYRGRLLWDRIRLKKVTIDRCGRIPPGVVQINLNYRGRLGKDLPGRNFIRLGDFYSWGYLARA